jgi:hypothetical protein
MEEVKRVNLADLPLWSEWPARLLGLSPFVSLSRTIEKIDQEYDKDKYARCLDYCVRVGQELTPEQVKQFEFGLDPSQEICVSSSGEILCVSLREARTRYYQFLRDTMCAQIEGCKTVVELGAGYGYNLWMLKKYSNDKSFWGAEYSDNAVRIAQRLYRDDSQISVVNFNFYDPETYGFLDKITPPIIVFTSHAIEQLPHSAVVLDNLIRWREKIEAVFHFEPVYELLDETLLGLMRRRYTQINDYNRDLLSELQKRSWIRIKEQHADGFGLNPLNPTSVICWEFT